MRDQHRQSPSSLAVIVMGVSGSGKTTLAQHLAARLGGPFIEGDTLHSPASVEKMRAGRPLEDADRWPWLDRVGAALQSSTAEGCSAVAACSALKFAYRERLRRAIAVPTCFILPAVGRDELARRMASRPGHFMPPALLDSQLATLEWPLPGENALVLDANLSPQESCEAVCRWLSAAASR